MKKIQTLLLCSFLLIQLPLFAQNDWQGKLEFDKKAHNFGEIKEDGGNVAATFSFTNVGNKPIQITYVKASCGCTTPTYTREPIAPGEKGLVRAEFNPLHRVGNFNKSISIRTDGDPQFMALKISGKVLPRKKGLTDWYPRKDGSLRFQMHSVAFGKVQRGEIVTKTSTIYNEGEKPVVINKAQTKTPHFCTVDFSNTTIQPKDSVKMTLTYDATKRNDWGTVYDNFVLVTNDTQKPKKRVSMYADIRQKFDLTQPQAKVEFDKSIHNFGDITEGDVVKTTFEIKNVGDAPLYIRKSKASCGCTATKPEKNELQPGESTKINVSFNSKGRKSNQHKTITVVCNDPLKEVTRLTIKANVRAKKK